MRPHEIKLLALLAMLNPGLTNPQSRRTNVVVSQSLPLYMVAELRSKNDRIVCRGASFILACHAPQLGSSSAMSRDGYDQDH